jgi:hypothetical protein
MSRGWGFKIDYAAAIREDEARIAHLTSPECLIVSRDLLPAAQVFEGREAAEAYASTISPSRDPIVSSISLSELRVGEDRGRLEYWSKR